jgi:hypothetical protein
MNKTIMASVVLMLTCGVATATEKAKTPEQACSDIGAA